MRQGDVIVKVNGQEVTPENTLSYLVANLPIGTRVPIELIRNGKRMTVTAVVGERPSEQKLAESLGGDFSEEGAPADNEQAAQAGLGISLQTLTPQIASQLRVPETTKGVVIAAVNPSSDAAQKGLQRGDIILSVNQQPVTTPQEAAKAVAATRPAGRDSVPLLVQLGPTPGRYVGVPLSRSEGRRVGKEWVSTCRTRWSRQQYKK